MLAAVSVMVAMPVLPEATEMGLAKVPAKPPLSVALAEPALLPMVIVLVLAPKAFALVVPLTVPALIVRPLLNAVFAPERTSVDVALFSVTPVTLLPIAPLIVVVPLLEPELVIVPVLLMVAVERVMPLAI